MSLFFMMEGKPSRRSRWHTSQTESMPPYSPPRTFHAHRLMLAAMPGFRLARRRNDEREANASAVASVKGISDADTVEL